MTTTAHVSDDRGDQTLCGLAIHPGTVVDRWEPGMETCFGCSEIAATRPARDQFDSWPWRDPGQRARFGL